MSGFYLLSKHNRLLQVVFRELSEPCDVAVFVHYIYAGSSTRSVVSEELVRNLRLASTTASK
jgi:hypothetical protein